MAVKPYRVNTRRIHVNTPITCGPAAKSDLLKTPNGNIPLGTVNNCANGQTPWGTYLTCEENFNGYFGASNREETWVATEAQERYGFSEDGFGYGWHLFDRRFDLSDPDYRNEENRFGWVVEIDPYDGTQVPVKRTALGRVKHEGATVTEGADGKVVVYMGDDQRFDYIYKFVSKDPWRQMKEGRDPLTRRLRCRSVTMVRLGCLRYQSYVGTKVQRSRGNSCLLSKKPMLLVPLRWIDQNG